MKWIVWYGVRPWSRTDEARVMSQTFADEAEARAFIAKLEAEPDIAILYAAYPEGATKEHQRALETAQIAALVCRYFEGDSTKAMWWMTTPNPSFGELVPIDLIMAGRSLLVLRFALQARQAEEVATRARSRDSQDALAYAVAASTKKDPKDLLKRIEALCFEHGAFAIVRADEDQKAFEKALMLFGLACYAEALEDMGQFPSVASQAWDALGTCGKAFAGARTIVTDPRFPSKKL